MIDLNTWNLSIPVGQPATTINTPLLASGYQDDYFKNINGTLFFWAPVNGSTTANAKYPRSELRETYADGKLRNWKYTAADNYLKAALTVTQVPSTGKIVIGQIHNIEGNDPAIKLSYQYKSDTRTGNIVAIYRTAPGAETQSITILKGVALGQSFTYTIRLTPGGTLAVYVKTPSIATVKWTATLDKAWAAQTMYFKAGNYVQDNTGDNTEAGSVRFTALSVEHL